MDLLQEFDRQVGNLLQKKYPEAANMSTQDFLSLITPLREKVNALPALQVDFEQGKLPFVIVIKAALVPTEKAMELVLRQGKTGVTKMYPRRPSDFNTIETEVIPEKQAYLLVDIDRGKESLNVTPSEALIRIREEKKLPLTIDEGVAIVTQYPDFIFKNNCFSLLASRYSGDKRVPAIWINGEKNVNLGWCWEGNPHTWLGSASGLRRI